MKNILSVFLGLLILGCTPKVENPGQQPVARVFDNYLYVSDLKYIIPQNLTEMDSLALVKDYIEKWAQKQLILKQAEANLTIEEKDVNKQIMDYRTSLLIFKYEQNLIQQKLDTIITADEIEKYHTKNSSNFILNENLAKGIYLKFPRNAPNLWKVRRWYTSDKEEDVKELDAYCYQYAKEVEYFEDEWIEFGLILDKMPRLYGTQKSLLENRKTIEVRDSTDYYFLRIIDYKLEGSVAPIIIVENNIKSILLNKRKIQLINRLEAEIYNDALNRGNFNIY